MKIPKALFALLFTLIVLEQAQAEEDQIFSNGFELPPISIQLEEIYRVTENSLFETTGTVTTTTTNDSIDISLSGDDDRFFSVSPLVSILQVTSSSNEDFRFVLNEEKDYEFPSDLDVDNTYEVNVDVFDGVSKVSKPVRLIIENFDEDIIDLRLSGVDGTVEKGPRLTLDLVIDNFTEAQAVSVLYWRGEKQYWTSTEETRKLPFKTIFSGIFEPPLDTPSGEWEIRKIVIHSPNGPIDFSKSLLEFKGFDVDIHLYNALSDDNDPELVDLGEFQIDGNDGNAETSIVASIDAHVDDVENAFSSAGGYLRSPHYDGGWGQVWSWATIDYSTIPNVARFTWVSHPRTVSGTYTIGDLRFYDEAGNKSIYRGNDGELGLFGSYTFELDNPIDDDSTPQLTDFELSGSTDNVTGRKVITLRTQVDDGQDQETPIKRQYVRIAGPNGNIDSDEFLLGEDGYFELTILLPLEAMDGKYYVSYWFIADAALNDNKLFGSELRDLGYTTEIIFP